MLAHRKRKHATENDRKCQKNTRKKKSVMQICTAVTYRVRFRGWGPTSTFVTLLRISSVAYCLLSTKLSGITSFPMHSHLCSRNKFPIADWLCIPICPYSCNILKYRGNGSRRLLAFFCFALFLFCLFSVLTLATCHRYANAPLILKERYGEIFG